MTTATHRYAARVQVGGVPRAGQVVHLGAKASPQFASQPIRMVLTADATPSAVDAAQHRPAATAQWLHLEGWEVDRSGKRLIQRNVSAFAAGISIIEHSNAAR